MAVWAQRYCIVYSILASFCQPNYVMCFQIWLSIFFLKWSWLSTKFTLAAKHPLVKDLIHIVETHFV